jgi:ubiquinone/menaquinone biosynthesis C-methylase UbiE
MDDPQRDGKTSGTTTLMPYWDRVASRYAAEDPLAAVCYPAAPRWFNRFYAYFQHRSVSRILAGEALRGKRALDVGCGSGRWSRFLRDRGAEVTGIDPTPAMLETAMRLSPGVEFRRMSATEIDLPAESVDFVLSVTVIQHLQPEEQVKAAASMCRVLKPGGRLFLLDLIDHNDPGRLVFPRRPQGWINLYQEHGARLVHWEGQEYVPLIRMLTALLPSQRNKGSAVTAPSVIEDIGAKRALFLATWPVIQISYPLELLCERLMPSDWARHACFLFEKPVKRAERT